MEWGEGDLHRVSESRGQSHWLPNSDRLQSCSLGCMVVSCRHRFLIRHKAELIEQVDGALYSHHTGKQACKPAGKAYRSLLAISYAPLSLCPAKFSSHAPPCSPFFPSFSFAFYSFFSLFLSLLGSSLRKAKKFQGRSHLCSGLQEQAYGKVRVITQAS